MKRKDRVSGISCKGGVKCKACQHTSRQRQFLRKLSSKRVRLVFKAEVIKELRQ